MQQELELEITQEKPINVGAYNILGEGWYNYLKDELDKPYMNKLGEFVTSRRNANIVYPEQGEVFNAYKYTPYEDVKVCIIGQD